jgi:transposase
MIKYIIVLEKETMDRQRNRVERLVGRLKQFRAVATRYDKLDGMFGGLVVLCPRALP